ncbi:uncharacterized protein [Eucyclogobius newberryi]|uniref:uncharacterized protein n=1 Tax=Eucyclogobius newberryi TaxID=166745 RepID=UPI003B5AFF83
MSEMIVNVKSLGASKSEETDLGTTTVEMSMLDAFEDKLIISQLVCEPAPELERCDSLESVLFVEDPQVVSPQGNQPTTDRPIQDAESAQPPEPRLTFHQPPEPRLTFHQPPEPRITFHQPPEPRITFHQPPEPRITFHQPPEQTVTIEQPPEPRVTIHQPPEQRVTIHQPLEQRVTIHQSPEQRVTIHQPPEPRVTIHQPLEQRVTIHEPPEQRVTIHQPLEQRVTIHQPPEQRVTIHQPPEPRVTIHQPLEQRVTIHQPLELKPQWIVGAQCQAVWSEDGEVYPATILSLEGKRCRVRFNGYDNEEDVVLSTLKQPEVQSKSTREWKAGSRCRAMYSVDRIIYSAVVLWVKGQRCRVRFHDYNNEEELDVSDLLSPNELNGPVSSGRGATWRPMFGTGARRRREASNSGDKQELEQDERGEREDRREGKDGGDRGKDPLHNTKQPKDKSMSLGSEEREVDEKKPAERPACPIFCSFPPFPPPHPHHPPPHSSGAAPPFMAPPPPFWAFEGNVSDSTSHMLMLWYMCGFHTGSYMAQQQKSSSRD